MWSNHLSFRFLTKVRYSPYFPKASWIYIYIYMRRKVIIYRLFPSLSNLWFYCVLQFSNVTVKVNVTRSILKKMSDVVTLWTFCYRDQSFINRRRVGYFFHGRRGTEPDPPPPPHTHTHTKQVEKILTLSDKTFLKPIAPTLPPRPPYTQTALTYDNPILLSGPVEY